MALEKGLKEINDNEFLGYITKLVHVTEINHLGELQGINLNTRSSEISIFIS